MNLQKAIEILNDLITDDPQFPPGDRRDAVKLGIEALHRVYLQRTFPVSILFQPLPNETDS